MDPEFEEHYQDLLKQWVKDEISIKEKLDQIEEKVAKKLDDLRESMVNSKRKTSDEGQKPYKFSLNRLKLNRLLL